MAKRKWTNRNGQSRDPLYAVWSTMHARCYNPGHNRYAVYGERGVTVCEEWQDYEPFKNWAHGAGYAKGRSIDRIDTNGNYEPSNCRWASSKEQNRNRRNNRLVTHCGDTKTLADWADDRRCVVPYKKLWERLEDGWDFERALTQPERRKGGYRMVEAWDETKSITEWLADDRAAYGLTPAALWSRINRGWPGERAIETSIRVRM